MRRTPTAYAWANSCASWESSLLERALELRVDLAHAALGDAEDVADLTQREVLDVEKDGDLALAPRQPLERRAEPLLGLLGGGRVLGIEPLVGGRQRVDPLDGRLLVGDHQRVERRDVGDRDVVLAAAQLLDRDRERLGELRARRRAAVDGGELVARPGDVALPAAQRPRRPVQAAQLVDHGAVDPGPRELLERGALLRVVAVDRGDQRLQPAGDEVLDLTARRQLAHLLEDDVLHERRERHHEPVAGPHVSRALVLAPERVRLVRGDAVAAGGRWRTSCGEGLLGRSADPSCIGPGPRSLDRRDVESLTLGACRAGYGAWLIP